MRKKPTDDLREELMEAPSIGAYLRNNADILAGQGIQTLLGDLFRRSGLSKAAAASNPTTAGRNPSNTCSTTGWFLYFIRKR